MRKGEILVKLDQRQYQLALEQAGNQVTLLQNRYKLAELQFAQAAYVARLVRLYGDGETVATLYAARRRVVPILITSTTTVAGLFSLALGLGGKSLIWGPVASSIVWGLGFSTVLTLFVIPLLYRLVMGPKKWMRRWRRIGYRTAATAAK